MIPRLLEPTKGNIFLNKINLKDIKVSSLKEQYALSLIKNQFLQEVLS